MRAGSCRLLQFGRIAAILPCLLSLATAPLFASQVRLVDLEQMTQRAARIFSGRCIETRVVFDAALGRDVRVATFRVHRAVKGVTGDTVTVRTLAVEGNDADAAAGVPVYRAGDEVVLFLYGESASGLSATVGLGQGRFRVLADKQGRSLALNDFGNRNLFTGLRPEARARLEARSATAQRAATQRGDDLEPSVLLDAAEALAGAER